MLISNLSGDTDYIGCTEPKKKQNKTKQNKQKQPTALIQALTPYRYRGHKDIMAWEYFPHYWPFVMGIYRLIPLAKGRKTDYDVFYDISLSKWLNK